MPRGKVRVVWIVYRFVFIGGVQTIGTPRPVQFIS